MTPQRIALKLFTTAPETAVDLHPFIGVFHRLIQRRAVDGLLVDVADYAHVPDGPGVILIGHDVDYGIDLAGGRSGLLTVRKRARDIPVPDLFRDTLEKALVAARAIEADPEAGLRFATDGLEVTFPDRLAAPNRDAAYELVRKALEPVASELFGVSPRLERIGADDPRRMLGLRFHGIRDGVEPLLTRLGRS